MTLLQSRLCTQEQLTTACYREWCARIGERPRLHRKQWEFYFIAQALAERDMLAQGRRGLGFGVGQEPLTALFAGYGCTIVATDVDSRTPVAVGWAASGEHASGLADLNSRGLCDPEAFERLVSFRAVDMNAVPPDLTGFDFVWSSCAFEHLGSIELGRQFVYRAMDCLRPGGVAVHTTEYNVSSDSHTLATGRTVLYRRRDVEEIAVTLTAAGHAISLDLDPGSGPADYYVDVPPYRPTPHLKLQLGGYVSTSIGLIVRKAEPR